MKLGLVIAFTAGSMLPAVADATHTSVMSGDTIIAQSTTGTTTSPGAVTTTTPGAVTTTTPSTTTVTGTGSTTATGTTATGTATTSTATGGITGAHDAFVLTCVFEVRTAPPSLLVLDASGSGTVPTIAPGTPCSQALGTLLSAGFIIASSLPSFDGATQYTLVR